MFNKTFSLLLLFTMSLSTTGCESPATDSSETNNLTEDSYSLLGESCEYFCYGPACNLTCEDNVIYRCENDNTWHLEEDCAAQESICGTTEPDMELSGYYTYVCED